MTNFSLTLPLDFSDYEWEVTAKGFFSEAYITVAKKNYRLNFYDPKRLSQQIEDELARGQIFYEPNLVIVPSVTKSHMEQAVKYLIELDQISSLIPE